jgi:hypothetical protein
MILGASYLEQEFTLTYFQYLGEKFPFPGSE